MKTRKAGAAESQARVCRNLDYCGRALDYFKKAYTSATQIMRGLKTFPLWKPMGGQPRFRALIAQGLDK